jgi:hypothetical protein
MDASADPALTVICRVCWLPFSEAVMIAVPGATPDTVKLPLIEPASTVTLAGTVATDGLLLVTAIEELAGAAAFNCTLARALPPGGSVIGLMLIALNVGLAEACTGLPEVELLQCAADSPNSTMGAHRTIRTVRAAKHDRNTSTPPALLRCKSPTS